MLARYHDFDYGQNGPDALARFLELPLDKVSPLRTTSGRTCREILPRLPA